jgi:hypothetical protein
MTPMKKKNHQTMTLMKKKKNKPRNQYCKSNGWYMWLRDWISS